MNNFIFICEEDFKEIISQAVILAVLLGNQNHSEQKENEHVQESSAH